MTAEPQTDSDNKSKQNGNNSVVASKATLASVLAPEERFDGLIHPKDWRWLWFERFVMLTVLATCMVEPFSAVFEHTLYLLDPEHHIPGNIYIFGYVLDVVYLIYVIIKFRVTYPKTVSYETSKWAVARRYMWDDFIIDLFSILPTDVFAFAWDTVTARDDAQGVLRLNRLVRMFVVHVAVRCWLKFILRLLCDRYLPTGTISFGQPSSSYREQCQSRPVYHIGCDFSSLDCLWTLRYFLLRRMCYSLCHSRQMACHVVLTI